MVIGIGIDVASVERMERSLERFGERIWRRILTEGEQRQLAPRRDRAIALASRFAAKEAATKALGGPHDVGWHDIEVQKGPSGAPILQFRGNALAHVERLGVSRNLLSITHDAGVAAAVVVLEGHEPAPRSP
jgi:holo-[acyl-carrier protein] synthase